MKGFSFQALVRAFTEQYQVGDLFLSLNAANPASHLGGKWVLLSGTASLSLGNGTNLDGVSLVGADVLAAPLLQHTHDAQDHDHTFDVTTSNHLGHAHAASGGSIGAVANHTHNRGTMEISGSWDGALNTAANPQGAFSLSLVYANNQGADGGDPSVSRVTFTASDSWTGNTSSNGGHTHSLTDLTIATGGAHNHTVSGTTPMLTDFEIDNTGTANATINTAGARLPVNVWKKTAM